MGKELREREKKRHTKELEHADRWSFELLQHNSVHLLGCHLSLHIAWSNEDLSMTVYYLQGFSLFCIING